MSDLNAMDRLLDRLLSGQERRHAWLGEASAQVRKWKAEDAAARNATVVEIRQPKEPAA